ncbi:MAG: sensor histidine kinase [Rhodocyclaceae bacterium]|nr:MAG: sensor histidine kinase [Rhodocyclaceae bacterium]
MRQKEPLSLRQRLLLALLTPLITILIVSSFFDYRLATQTANAAHDQALTDNVFDLEAHIKSHDSSLELDLSEESEAMLRSNAPDTLYFSVTDASGKLVTGDADLPAFALPKSDRVEMHDASFRGAPVRAAVHRIVLGEREFRIVVMETTGRRDEASLRILTAMIVPNLLVILATLLAVVFGVRQGLLPLREVEGDIAARSASDLHEIELAGTPAEIRPMLRRLNELFGLVRDSVDIQQRFIADAAHQLRTPLAGLQTQIDLATAEGAFSDKTDRLQAIEEASSSIGHLLSQLLAYARAETTNPLRGNLEMVAIDRLVEDSASIFLDASLNKNIDFGFEIEPAATPGFPWMLKEALSNLIDNALRYTPVGGIVTVRCGVRENRAFMEVEDSGPGIPEAQRQQVFERFYRIPGSPGNGCGLGLPIVREIAQLHGAEVQLADSRSGGLCARVVFPNHPGPASGS